MARERRPILLLSEDLIDGLIRLMDSPEDVTGPINLGNPVEFTICQLAQLILELTGSRSELCFFPFQAMTPSSADPILLLQSECSVGNQKPSSERGF